MSINAATIQELIGVFREDYGREVTQAEASEIAVAIVDYLDFIAKIYRQQRTNNNDDYDRPANK